MAQRKHWLDIARGTGITLVVYGHVMRGLTGSGIVPDGSFAIWSDYTLYTFHMPLFFFLAGLNVRRVLGRSRPDFLVSKLWTVAYPYVLWSIMQGVILVEMSGAANGSLTFHDIAMLWRAPYSQFWFLYSLMICHLIVCVLPLHRGVLIAVGLILYVTGELLPQLSGFDWGTRSFIFYAAGIILDRWVAGDDKGAAVGWPALAAVWVAFAGYTTLKGITLGLSYSDFSALPAAALGITGVILFSKLASRWRIPLLSAIGRDSMAIYILHIMAGSGTRILLLRLHVPPEPVIYVIAGTIAGVLAPMAASVVLRRLGLLAATGLALPARMRAGTRSPVASSVPAI